MEPARGTLSVLTVAALVLAACAANQDAIVSEEAPDAALGDGTPATEPDTAETAHDAHEGTEAVPGDGQPDTDEGRTFVVDWQRAAETSGGGLERDVAPVRISMSLPDHWYSMFGWTVTRDNAQPPAGAGITFDRPLALFEDRCRWDEPDRLIEVGPTVDDLVGALSDHPQYAATNVTDILVSGFAGKELDVLAGPEDHDVTGCSAGPRPDGSNAPHLHRPWPGRYWMGPTQSDRLRVLDVDGERVVIRSMHYDGTPPEVLLEQREILDSITIETDD